MAAFASTSARSTEPVVKFTNCAHFAWIAVTWDGSKVRAYVDGTQVGSAVPLSQTLNTQGTWFYLGSYFNGGTFTGSLDDVAVFPKALTAGQLAALHAAAGSPVAHATARTRAARRSRKGR